MYTPFNVVTKDNIHSFYKQWEGHCVPESAFVVVYHENCNDGIVAACVTANVINTRFNQDHAIYIPANYGEDSFSRVFKENKDLQEFMAAHIHVNLIIVDFSFAPTDMSRQHVFSFTDERLGKLSEVFDSVLILDHHISSCDNYRAHFSIEPDQFDLHENCYYLFNEENTMSGASMAWKFFHGDAPESELVKVVEDRDLWKHVNPLTEQGYFLVNDLNFGATRSTHSKNPFASYVDHDDPAVEAGEKMTAMLLSNEAFEKEAKSYDHVVKYHKKTVEAIARRYFVSMLDTFEKNGKTTKQRVAFVNCPSQYASDVCASIYNKHQVDYVLSFTIVQKGSTPMVNVSMRSPKDGADVSEICGYFGGGGHKHAAGCVMTLLDFISYFDFTPVEVPKAPYVNRIDVELLDRVSEVCQAHVGRYAAYGVATIIGFILLMYTVLKA